MHTILQSLAKTSAQPQSNLRIQDDLVVTIVLYFQPTNPIEVHDDRAVNANKLGVTQFPLKLQQRPTHDVRVITHVQAGVIVCGLDLSF